MGNPVHKDVTRFGASCAQVPEDHTDFMFMETRHPEGICISNRVGTRHSIFDDYQTKEQILEQLEGDGLQVVLSIDDATKLQKWLEVELDKYKKYQITRLITE